MKDALSHVVEDGNSDEKIGNISMAEPIDNDKILDERPLELSDAKLIDKESFSISKTYEQLCLELEDLQINGNLASDSDQ